MLWFIHIILFDGICDFFFLFLQLQEETVIISGLVPIFKDLPLGKVTEQRFSFQDNKAKLVPVIW